MFFGQDIQKVISLLTSKQLRFWLFITVLELISSLIHIAGLMMLVPLMNLFMSYETSVGIKYIAYIHNFVGSPQKNEMLLMMFVFSIFFISLGGFLSVVHVYLTGLFKSDVNIVWSKSVFINKVQLPLEVLEENSQIEFSRSSNGDVQRVISDYLIPMSNFLASIVFLFLLISILFYINPFVMFFLILVLVLIYLGVNLKYKSLAYKKNIEIYDDSNDLEEFSQSIYSNIKNIKIDMMVPEVGEKFEKLMKKISESKAMLEVYRETPHYIVESAGIIVLLLASCYMGVSGLHPEVILANVVVLAICAYRVMPLLQKLIQLKARMKSGSKFLRKLYKNIMGQDRDRNDKSLHFGLTNFHEILLKDVSYNFPSNKKLFDHLNLSIPLSKSLAINGPSGAGKSTLIEIILGLRAVKSGQLLFNKKIKSDQVDYSSWWSNVSYVSQSFYLFGESIREIISFGFIGDGRRFDKNELEEVLYISGLKEVMESKNITVDDYVGPNGKYFSGGERSRIAVARSLYKRSNIIIFDEVLSSMDIHSVDLVLSRIKKMRPNTVLIIISHRKNELKYADNIVNL